MRLTRVETLSLRCRRRLSDISFRLIPCYVRRRTQVVATLDPYLRQLLLDLVPARIHLLYLREALAEFLQLTLDMHLLPLGPDALELPLVATLSHPQHEVVCVVLLQRRASRDGNQG